MNPEELYGQWIGRFEGEAPGWALLNIEPGRSRTPFVCMTQQFTGPMATHVHLEVAYEGDQFKGEAKSIRVYDSSKNTLVEPKEFLAAQTDLVVASRISIEGTWSEHYLNGTFATDISNGGKFRLSNPAKQLTEPPNHIFTWNEFYAFALESMKRGGKVYRGQASNSWRLRSSFHRARRYDLSRYWKEVCLPMRDRLAKAGIEFDINKSEDIGSMICFAQHHGFPTPLLDWSFDPMVAAYFAFDRSAGVYSPNQSCRIYAFDFEEWAKDTNNGASFADPNPLASFRRFDSKNVKRQELQKCMHAFLNVEDFEAWVRMIEADKKKTYLTTIDIPWSQSGLAKADLAKQGYLTDKLFDGNDALCKSLRESLLV